jgi:hypothetical protein
MANCNAEATFELFCSRESCEPVHLDRHGLPRYWATVWSTASAGQLAASAHQKKLRYIDNLYAHPESLCGVGALYDALGSLDDATLAEILESWFVSIQNQPKTFGGDETRWQTGFRFVSSIVTRISKSDANSHLQPIQSRLQQLSILCSQLHVKKQSSTEKVRSLPASTIEGLYTMLDPESAHNPFRRIRTRRRIYVSFLLMKAFQIVSAWLPQDVIKELQARTGKEVVTPHDLRHTCAVMRLNQLLKRGDSMDEALHMLRTFFGWSKDSMMPSRYARAVFEDRLASILNDAFDDRVTLLRSLAKGL